MWDVVNEAISDGGAHDWERPLDAFEAKAPSTEEARGRADAELVKSVARSADSNPYGFKDSTWYVNHGIQTYGFLSPPPSHPHPTSAYTRVRLV